MRSQIHVPFESKEGAESWFRVYALVLVSALGYRSGSNRGAIWEPEKARNGIEVYDNTFSIVKGTNPISCPFEVLVDAC